MKLIVISPESHDSRELSVVRALLAAGLERYHLRKPSWSTAELETWLRALGQEERRHVVVHARPELVKLWDLAGYHERDEGRVGEQATGATKWCSRSCHDLDSLQACLGKYNAVLLGPIFPSISKPGYGPTGKIDLAALTSVLINRTPEQRRTAVFALGGIEQTKTEACARLGFDGVAVLGAIWNTDDPVAAFGSIAERAKASALRAKFAVPKRSELPCHPIMCLTQDGLPLSHVDQATRLCAAGARWIQLRMKNASPAEWLTTALAVGAICRDHGAIFIVNDSVDIALQAGADGVHLGKLDLDWVEARRKLGSDRIVGGTINNSIDVSRARAAGCLDYVGVGPWRFTSNKKNLAPVLGPAGVASLISELGELPAWVIGGIEASDLGAVQTTGAAGVAVSSALYRGGEVDVSFEKFADGWPASSNDGRPCPPRRRKDASRSIEPPISVTTL